MTDLQKIFIDILDEFGYDIFSVQMIKDTNRLSVEQIYQAIRTLNRSQLIIKLERGKYIRSGFMDSFVIANFLAPDGGVAYWSAMNYHGLTEQFTNVVFVQTAKRNNEEVNINGSRYKFIKVNIRKITGYKTIGYGNHKYKITDIEKTIVDCFDLPHLAGWYQEIIKAFYQAKVNQNRLIKYCKIIDNTSIIKRLAFLSELLEKPNMEKFIDFALLHINKDYSVFEIDKTRKGKLNKRWKLILNMDEEEILEIANS
jgi:predicted transcriptional regulator of viral defense system